MWLLLSPNPKFSTSSLSCSTHPRDKQTLAYRLHLGARAVAYGAKLTFQGPLPQKIELLGDMGLLNLTYSQPIQVQRHDKIFEVRTAETAGAHPVGGSGFPPRRGPPLIITWLWGRFWLVRGWVYLRATKKRLLIHSLRGNFDGTTKEGKTCPRWNDTTFAFSLPEQPSLRGKGLWLYLWAPVERTLAPECFPHP